MQLQSEQDTPCSHTPPHPEADSTARGSYSPLRARVLAVGDGHLSQVEEHGALQGSVPAAVAEAADVHV